MSSLTAPAQESELEAASADHEGPIHDLLRGVRPGRLGVDLRDAPSLRALDVEVKPMGEPLTRLLQDEGWNVMTF